MNLLNMLKAHLVSNGRAAPTENSLIIDESYASSIVSPVVIGFANNKYENISRLLSGYAGCPYALAYALDVVQPLLSLGWEIVNFDGSSFWLRQTSCHYPMPGLKIWLPAGSTQDFSYLGLPANDQPMVARLIELILRWRKSSEITVGLDRRDRHGFLEWQLAVKSGSVNVRPFVMGVIQRKAGDRVEVHS